MEAHGLSEAVTLDAAAVARPPTALVCRVLDVLLAAVLLVLLLPLFVAVALAIRLDSPGPMLYRQLRVGLGMRRFTLHKFRTMRPDADSQPHHDYVVGLIRGQAEAVSGSHGSLYKLAHDERITPVGRFLRRWSLDELPQLFDVLRGEMSLVGPRPAIPYELDHYERSWYRRFSVKPGLTGLWQVSGRNKLTFHDMVRLDIEYAETWCLRLNVLILAKTPWVVVRGRGAV
jgi:lipopolysaccharide/colanic/teichoic acid biosynthesis glycosyltransferase